MLDTNDHTYLVRLLGTKRDRFVEFEFAIDDSDLSVELVMPFREFLGFVERYGARQLEPTAEARDAFAKLARIHESPDVLDQLAGRPETGGDQ